MTKFIFLDIDGVLNSHRQACGSGGIPYHFNEELKPRFDWNAVGMLRKLQQEDLSIKFVLSSSWRIGAPNVYEVAGNYLGISFHGQTDTKGYWRGEEIQRYLDANPEVEDYAIIDDDSDMLESQKDHFVQTTFRNGMLYDHFVALQNILDRRNLGTKHYRTDEYWLKHLHPDFPERQYQEGISE